MGECGWPDLDTVAVIHRPVAKACALAWVNLAIVAIMNVHLFSSPYAQSEISFIIPSTSHVPHSKLGTHIDAVGVVNWSGQDFCIVESA